MSSGIAERVASITERVRGLSPTAVDKPVLVYFDIIGIAFPIRCLLHLEEVDYELVQIPIEVWAYQTPTGEAPLQGCFRNGHVPLYVDQEVCLNQSKVILNYLGEKYGLLGDSPAEKLAALEVMEHAYDALFHWGGLFQVNVRIATPDDVVEARRDAFFGSGSWGLVTDGYRKNLDAFVRYLDASPSSDFIAGSRLSVADLYAYNVLCNWYKAFDRERFVDGYPQLDAYVHHIAGIPGVADYIENGQEPTAWFPYPTLALKLTTADEQIGLTSG